MTHEIVTIPVLIYQFRIAVVLFLIPIRIVLVSGGNPHLLAVTLGYLSLLLSVALFLLLRFQQYLYFY